MLTLTFDLRNFLVSRWMRALSVNRLSDGRRDSFSLCPWKTNTLKLTTV